MASEKLIGKSVLDTERATVGSRATVPFFKEWTRQFGGPTISELTPVPGGGNRQAKITSSSPNPSCQVPHASNAAVGGCTRLGARNRWSALPRERRAGVALAVGGQYWTGARRRRGGGKASMRATTIHSHAVKALLSALKCNQWLGGAVHVQPSIGNSASHRRPTCHFLRRPAHVASAPSTAQGLSHESGPVMLLRHGKRTGQLGIGEVRPNGRRAIPVGQIEPVCSGTGGSPSGVFASREGNPPALHPRLGG